ncbi:MAG: hypothetical protein AAGL90_11910 [Pseudomonadota bacterium]
MHPLLKTLCDDAITRPLSTEGIETFIKDCAPGLRIIFLAGDPDKKLETADVAVVLREFTRLYPRAFEVAIGETPEAEKQAMELSGVFALPSLIFFANGKKLETLPKIQDWSVYAEALPRLIEASQTETVS